MSKTFTINGEPVKLTKKRIKCQALDPKNKACNRSAKIETRIRQDFMQGKLRAVVYLCPICAARDITAFFRSTYDALLEIAKMDLEQEEWAKDARKAEKHIAKIKEHNRKVHAHNELIRAEEAGEISAAELASGIDAIYPERAIARAEGYNEAKKEMMQRMIQR